MTNLVYENDNYLVRVDHTLECTSGGIKYVGGYVVVNKATGIKEFGAPQMPEALYASEQLNHALLSKGWEWRKEKQVPELNPELLVN